MKNNVDAINNLKICSKNQQQHKINYITLCWEKYVEATATKISIM
jgi:hypothetical protein